MKKIIAGGTILVSTMVGVGMLYRTDSPPAKPVPNPGHVEQQDTASPPPHKKAAPGATAEKTVENNTVPDGVVQQLPKQHHIIASLSADFNGDGRKDYVLVIGHDRELKKETNPEQSAPKRPLMVFLQGESGSFILSARNDHVAYAADEGGQCDPFLDGAEGLAVKSEYFTVQNGVACGQHWTDYMTFKYSKELKKFIFHKRIYQSMEMNQSGNHDGPLLVPDTSSVTVAKKSQPVLLENYKPNP